GRAKLEGEALCANYARLGLEVTIIRPRTIMRHGRLGIFQILFEWIREGYNVPVFDGGSNIYQFVHADDLAEACIQRQERPVRRLTIVALPNSARCAKRWSICALMPKPAQKSAAFRWYRQSR